jgi:hypothetical protein
VPGARRHSEVVAWSPFLSVYNPSILEKNVMTSLVVVPMRRGMMIRLLFYFARAGFQRAADEPLHLEFSAHALIIECLPTQIYLDLAHARPMLLDQYCSTNAARSILLDQCCSNMDLTSYHVRLVKTESRRKRKPPPPCQVVAIGVLVHEKGSHDQ